MVSNKTKLIAKCLLINNENKFLILKRSDYKGDGTQNLWDIPGGSVDDGEEINFAMKREIFEEIKLEINDLNLVGKNLEGIPEKRYIFNLFVSNNFDNKQDIILSGEHLEYKWISVDEIKNFNFYLNKERLEIIKKYFLN